MPTQPSELGRYVRTALFGAVVFGLFSGYTSWMKIPNVLNKSMADTAIFLMGASMIMSSLCYFFNFFDGMIGYRKQLGLIGFAFAITHAVLSLPALEALFKTDTWQKGMMWAPLSGVLALYIFSMMAMISNRWMATVLGGKIWKFILHGGYLAVVLTGIHLVVLKYGRWVTWYTGGMKTPPSTSMIIGLWIVIVLIMRLLLWLATRSKRVR